MNQKRTKVFQVFAWIVAIYHLTLGIFATFAGPNLLQQIVKLYNVQTEITPQFQYLAKFIAAYGIALGVMMTFVAINPKKYHVLAWGAIVLFAVRIFDRLFYFDLLNQAFDATMQQNLVTVVTVGILGGGLFLFMPREK